MLKLLSPIISTLLIIFLVNQSFSQIELPKHMTPEERAAWPAFYEEAQRNTKVVSPPPGPVRAPAEWEELQAISITWRSYQSHLAEIVRHAQMECKVIINCSDSNTVKSYLTSANVPLTSNLIFNVVASNSVWIRDYGSYSVYQNDVEDLFLIDWKYNRSNRPDDDVLPLSHASLLQLPIYEMSANPYLLVHTGGNLMFDGLGTAMSSKLVLNENTALTEAQVDNRMSQFFGTHRYIKFDVLPYDGINHIDMHMKLLDEETILVGEYPPGISDGPQIEANLLYLQNNHNSVFGTPYKLVRIPMPHSPSNPNNWPSGSAYYSTYTNGILVNKTFIYPTYYEKFDTTALRILTEALPGYKLVGINCDPNPISASGAIHCITNNIWEPNPLLISHQRLNATDSIGPFKIEAHINHRTGIANAHVYYTTDTTQLFLFAPMTLTDSVNNTWTGYIPAQTAGSKVYYYIHAAATSGKSMKRPITAPSGFWQFQISMFTDVPQYEVEKNLSLQQPFPNPARSITCVPVESSHNGLHCKIDLIDIHGRIQTSIFEGQLNKGTNHFFFNAMDMKAGVYFVRLTSLDGMQTKRILVYGY
jgi:agmatine deiminase